MLRVQYLDLKEKNRNDRKRLNTIKKGLEAAWVDLRELRKGESSSDYEK